MFINAVYLGSFRIREILFCFAEILGVKANYLYFLFFCFKKITKKVNMVINKNSRKIKKNNLNSNQKNDQKLSKIRKKHLKIKKDLEDRLMESKEGIEYIHK